MYPKEKNNMTKPIVSTHIDLVLVAEVAAGRLPATTPVAKTRIQDTRTGKCQFETLFVAFNRDGSPKVDEKGQLRLNHRTQD